MTDRTWSAVQVHGRRRWTTRTSPPGALVSWTRPAEGESVLTAGDAIVCGVEDDAPRRASLTHRLRRVMHLMERRCLFCVRSGRWWGWRVRRALCPASRWHACHLDDLLCDVGGLAGKGIVQQKGAPRACGLSATILLLALRRFAMAPNIRPVAAWAMQHVGQQRFSPSGGIAVLLISP